jgi:hypothetical protein
MEPTVYLNIKNAFKRLNETVPIPEPIVLVGRPSPDWNPTLRVSHIPLQMISLDDWMSL